MSQFLSYWRLIPLIKRLEYSLRDLKNKLSGFLQDRIVFTEPCRYKPEYPSSFRFLFGDTRKCLIRSEKSFYQKRTIQVQHQMMKRILRYKWMFLFTQFTDLNYLSTNISAGRSVECEVISDIFSCCERFKAPLNFLNFYSQDACLEEGLPTLAIRRFNSFFDLLQSKSTFLFFCSTEKQKKENIRLTPPHYTFMLVTEPGIFVNLRLKFKILHQTF